MHAITNPDYYASRVGEFPGRQRMVMRL